MKMTNRKQTHITLAVHSHCVDICVGIGLMALHVGTILWIYTVSTRTTDESWRSIHVHVYVLYQYCKIIHTLLLRILRTQHQNRKVTLVIKRSYCAVVNAGQLLMDCFLFIIHFDCGTIEGLSRIGSETINFVLSKVEKAHYLSKIYKHLKTDFD